MSDAVNKVVIQTSISGFSGKPVTLLSVLFPDLDSIVVSEQRDYKKGRLNGVDVFISDDARADSDATFLESELQEAINCYYKLVNTPNGQGVNSLSFQKGVRASCDPDSYIERDGMTESGWKYEVQEIKCGAAAVLATALYRKRSHSIDSAMDMMDTITSIMGGNGVTI